MNWDGAKRAVTDFLADFKRAQAGTHAASTSYFFFMSIVPLLIIYAGLMPNTGINAKDVSDFLCQMIPDDLDVFVVQLVNEAFANAGLALSISVISLLWTGSQGATALRFGLNAAYGVEDNRNRLTVALISIAFIVVLIATLSVVVYLLIGTEALRALASVLPSVRGTDETTTMLTSLVTMVVTVFVFAACYTYLAAGKRKLRSQLPGAVFASVAWFLLSFGFHIYLAHSAKYSVFYGSLGAVALFLFWMYLIFYILLIGAFLNRYYASWLERHLPFLYR